MGLPLWNDPWAFGRMIYYITLFVTITCMLNSALLSLMSRTERFTTHSVCYAHASAYGLVLCIYDAVSLCWYVITRLLSNGYFHAYRPTVLGLPLPYTTSPTYKTLSTGLGCFPLDDTHLAVYVCLTQCLHLSFPVDP